jgi:hypothetical protein
MNQQPTAENSHYDYSANRSAKISRKGLVVRFLLVASLTLIGGNGIRAQQKEYGADLAGITPDWHRIMTEKLNLWKFSEEEDVFQFRFWHKGQVIDIIQHPNYSNSNLVTYAYVQHRNRPQDTLTNGFSFGQISLSVEALHAYIQLFGILDIPSDPMVDGFVERHHPDDALIGFRDPSSGTISFISYTTYRLPQKPFNETNGGSEDQAGYIEFLRRKALVEEFIIGFTDLLQLTESYSNFETFHLKMIGGCFTRDGMEGRKCYNNIMLSYGYHAAKGTPLGYSAGLSLNTLGMYKPQLSFGVYHRMDLRGHFSFKGAISRHHTFSPKKKMLPAYGLYEYMTLKRPGAVDGPIQQYQRHCALYSVQMSKDSWLLNRISVAAGASYITGDEEAAGPVVAVSFFSLYGAFALIEKEVDYLLSWQVNVPVRHGKTPLLFVQLGLDYERFSGQNRFLFSVGALRW